jgi:hypothetical protein
MTTVEHLSEFWGRLPLDVKELILPYVRHPCASMILRACKIYCAEKRKVCWVELEHPELWRLVELYNRALDIQRSFNRERSLLLYMGILAAISHWDAELEELDELELTAAQDAYVTSMQERLLDIECRAYDDLQRA